MRSKIHFHKVAAILEVKFRAIANGNMAVNILVLLVSGIPMETVNLWMFLGITAVASLTASTLSTPFLLLVTLLPAFSSLIPELKKVCVFLFTGVVAEMAESYAAGQGYQLSLLSGIVLAATAVLASALFLLAYKDNGYEKE